MTETDHPASAPHHSAPAKWLRRGEFWLSAHRTGCTSYVRWEAPGDDTGEAPIVMVHGGGGQSVDWTTTPDGDYGWAHQFVDAGHPVYLPDRPGHGRSPYRPDIHGDRLPAPGPTDLQHIFTPVAPDSRHDQHTAWPWGREPGCEQFDALAASTQQVLADLATAHRLDGDMLVALLERIGPAAVIAHSAGVPSAWVAAQRRPDLVTAVVAIEPLGPPYRDFGQRGRLEYGLTSIPLHGPHHAAADDPASPPRLEGLAATPIAIVTADASGRHEADRATAEFLRASGAHVDHLRLADIGLLGHGHGLVFERGHDRIAAVVQKWLHTNSSREFDEKRNR